MVSAGTAFLAGRTALVTGSGRNIGRAIALAFAQAGANVVVNGHRDLAAIDSVADEIRALGAQAQAVEHFGAVDVAVSNVGVRLHQPFLDISLEDWRRVLDTNLSAAFYLARYALPHMTRRGWGRIIHLSGRDGFHPKPNRAHNVTCKAGLFALAKAIAVEFGPHRSPPTRWRLASSRRRVTRFTIPISNASRK